MEVTTMNKQVKKIITFTALAGGVMYAFNKFIDYTSSYRGLTFCSTSSKFKISRVFLQLSSIYRLFRPWASM